MPSPSPSLERHSYYLEAITSSQTLPDLSSIRTEYTVDTVINDQQRGILKSRYEIREMQLKALYTAKPGQAAPAYALDPKERVAITHAQDDLVAFGESVLPNVTSAFGAPDKEPVTAEIADQVFPDVEIITTNSTPNEIPTPPVEVPTTTTSTTPAPIAPVVDSIEPVAWPIWQVEQSEETVPKKRTRASSKDREDGTGSGWTKGTSSVTLSREIKLPIDGVQFSNNLFGITLTAPTYEEAKAGIEEAFADYTERTKLISFKTLGDEVAKAYTKWLAEWAAKVATPVQKEIAPAVKAVYKDNLERSRAMILQLCAAFPEAKTFAQEFAKLNPIIQEQPIV